MICNKTAKIVMVALIMITLCFNVNGQPIYNDADNGFQRVSILTYNQNNYSQVEEDRLNVYYMGATSSNGINVTVPMTVPYSVGVIAIDFQLCWDQGYIYAYSAFPQLIDKDGNVQQIFTTRQDGKIFLNSYQQTALTNCNFHIGGNYKVRIVCDLNNYKYSMLMDSGYGFVQAAIGIQTKWNLNLENISKVQFIFMPIPNNTTQCKASFGYINCFELPDDSVFVSSESGDDLNTGTYDMPFKTIEKALTVGTKYVRLKSGVYTFDEQYTYGHLDQALPNNKTAFVPINGTDIQILGGYILDTAYIDSFPMKEEYRTSLLQAIRNEKYMPYYDSEPIYYNAHMNYIEASNIMETSVELGTNSAKDTSANIIVCIYENGNKLHGMNYVSAAASAGEKKTYLVDLNLPEDVFSGSYTIKSFLLNNLVDLIPLKPAIEYTDISLNTTIEDAAFIVAGNIIIVTGSGTPGNAVTVKINDSDNGIAYLNQGIIDQQGKFALNCKLKSINVKPYIVNVVETAE